MTQPLLDVLADADALAEHAADLVLKAVLATDGPFSVALSGGSTPKRLYQRLASLPFPWARTHWFWGDERFVLPDDPASNYRMTYEAMFAHVSEPEDQIHPAPTVGLAPDVAAAQYAATLKSFHGAEHLTPGRPLFDIVLLGLGTDGHTASLFPGKSLVAGPDKADRLREVLSGDKRLPAARLQPHGTLRFLADRAAAGA